jgi:hypothetical protein
VTVPCGSGTSERPRSTMALTVRLILRDCHDAVHAIAMARTGHGPFSLIGHVGRKSGRIYQAAA